MNTDEYRKNKIKDETIEQTYSRVVCSICTNKEKCSEELRRKMDGTVKCDNYNTEFVANRNVERLRFSTKW